jgi:hypothetical protein
VGFFPFFIQSLLFMGPIGYLFIELKLVFGMEEYWPVVCGPEYYLFFIGGVLENGIGLGFVRFLFLDVVKNNAARFYKQ